MRADYGVFGLDARLDPPSGPEARQAQSRATVPGSLAQSTQRSSPTSRACHIHEPSDRCGPRRGGRSAQVTATRRRRCGDE